MKLIIAGSRPRRTDLDDRTYPQSWYSRISPLVYDCLPVLLKYLNLTIDSNISTTDTISLHITNISPSTITDYSITTNVVDEIISGNANGIDHIGESYGYKNQIAVKLFKADWNYYGPLAGRIRNKQMAEYADALIAFWDGESSGTDHMISCMNNLGKPTVYTIFSHLGREATLVLGDKILAYSSDRDSGGRLSTTSELLTIESKAYKA